MRKRVSPIKLFPGEWPADHPFLPYVYDAQKMVSKEGYTWPQALAYLRVQVLGMGIESRLADKWLNECAKSLGVNDQIRF